MWSRVITVSPGSQERPTSFSFSVNWTRMSFQCNNMKARELFKWFQSHFYLWYSDSLRLDFTYYYMGNDAASSGVKKGLLSSLMRVARLIFNEWIRRNEYIHIILIFHQRMVFYALSWSWQNPVILIFLSPTITGETSSLMKMKEKSNSPTQIPPSEFSSWCLLCTRETPRNNF